MTVLPGPSTGRDDAAVASRSRRGRGRARRRRRADRRDGGLGLPRAAGSRPARRRPDDPAHPAALPRAGRDRRPTLLRRGRRARSARPTAAPSPATTCAPSSTSSCARWACWPRQDGSQPEVKKSNPLLALRFKYAVSDPEQTRRLTAPFARLFHPVLVVAGDGGVPGRELVGVLPQGPGVRDVRSLRQARPAAARRRWSPSCRPASTSSGTPRRPAAAAPRPA